MDSVTLFRLIILANELDNNSAFAYRFSDPDGVRTGKSGWSFGVCQYDINNNPSAVLCLRECEFTTDEISALKAQTCDIKPMNSKLALHGLVVDKWDEKQLHECLSHPLQLCRDSNIRFADDETPFHIADYHNQFYMSRSGKMHGFLANLQRPVTPTDILNFKLQLPWGMKRRDDVQRRFDNIQRLYRDSQ